MKNFKMIKIIGKILGAFIILGVIVYLGNYSLRLHKVVQDTISHLQQQPQTVKLTDLSESLSTIQKNWQKISAFTKQFQFWQKQIESLITIMPKIKNDVQLRKSFSQLMFDAQHIIDGSLISDILNKQDNNLFYLQDLRDNLDELSDLQIGFIKEMKKKTDAWLWLLGEKEPRHYLVLIQIPELPRPTGGFVGAYLIINLNQGRISLEGDHISDLDDKFSKVLIPPQPLQVVSNRWFFHDLNWFYDVNSSGRKILEYYNQDISVPVLDGVIFINPSLIEEILSVVGEVKIDEYNLTVNSDNWETFFVSQVKEGLKPAPVRTQPEVLSLFFDQLFQKLRQTPPDELMVLLKDFSEDYANKDIQIYLKDAKLTQVLFSRPELNNKKSSNYLAVIFNYIGKDFILDSREKNIKLTEKIQSSDKIIDTLTISATPKTPDLENYLKVYLPPGVKIVKAKGCYLKTPPDYSAFYENLRYAQDTDVFLLEHSKEIDEKNQIEIYQKDNQTVIGCWAKLSSRPVVLEYLLPFSLKKGEWKVSVFYQSGQNIRFWYQLHLLPNQKLAPTLLPMNKWVPLVRDLKLNFQIQDTDNQD